MTNTMPRMRTIDAAYKILKDADPQSALTKTALRRLIVSNTVPSIKIGNKYLFSLDLLEAYIAGEIQPIEPQQQIGTIRRVSEGRC